MKKILTISSLAALLAFSLPARDAADFFVTSPLTNTLMTDSLTRLDMLDYYHAGSDMPSKAILGGTARVVAETPGRVDILVGDSLRYSLSVVTSSPTDTLLCVITTMSLPMRDSRVQFFNTDWTTPRAEVIDMPGIAQWFPDKKVRDDAREQLPFITAEWSYDPATLSLVAVPTIAGYFHPTDTPSSVTMLPDSLVYRWTGKNFKLVK